MKETKDEEEARQLARNYEDDKLVRYGELTGENNILTRIVEQLLKIELKDRRPIYGPFGEEKE